MGGSKKLVVASAIAAYAMTAAARPAEAPQFDYRSPGYASSHKLVPAPVTGIRGEAGVLKTPDAG
jgi:hypothetical protein